MIFQEILQQVRGCFFLEGRHWKGTLMCCLHEYQKIIEFASAIPKGSSWVLDKRMKYDI